MSPDFLFVYMCDVDGDAKKAKPCLSDYVPVYILLIFVFALLIWMLLYVRN